METVYSRIMFNQLSLLRLLPVALLLWCCREQRTNERLLSTDGKDIEAITYEGEVAFSAASVLSIEVTLIPAGESDGRYHVNEFVGIPGDESAPFEQKGFYSVFRNEKGDKMLVLENSARPAPLRRTTELPSGSLREENFRNDDLTFLVNDDVLVMMDGESIVSSEPEHYLYRRTTPEFTIEGYYMYRGDTSVYYEMNTKTKWPLAKLRRYFQAASEHNQLVDRKNDTTYLKATGYCISFPNTNRKTNALVLKRILQSSTL